MTCDRWGVARASIMAAFAWLAVGGMSPPVLKTVLDGRYAAIKAAMAKRDPLAIKALLAPGFASVDTSNKVQTATAMIDEVVALPVDTSKTSVTTIKIRRSERNSAIVDQRYDAQIRKTGPDGTEHQIELIALSTDTWVLRKSEWLMQRTVTEELTYFVDGKFAQRIRRPHTGASRQ